MQFYTFPLLLIPLASWVLCAAFLIYGEVKMVSGVLHNRELGTLAKVLWSVVMVPFLPIAALAYFISTHVHRNHTQHYTY